MARYENFIIENKINEYLTSKLGMSQFLTVDNTLTETDGMTKKVHKYTVTGSAETVAEGEGNTAALTVGYTPVDYTVKTTQAKFEYTDEADMVDSFYVDKGVEALAKAIINQYNAAAIAEFEKTTNVVYTNDGVVDFENFADALAQLNLEDADEVGFFALVNPKMKAIIRKSLGQDLRYVEDYARNGYVGSVCGIPIYTSKLVSDGTVIIANKNAVTCFVKKNATTEQERDAELRKNKIIARDVNVIALTNEGYCVKIKVGSQG